MPLIHREQSPLHAHLQGIKFYDPEIADDSPESVELVGTRALMAAAAPHIGLTRGLPMLKVSTCIWIIWHAAAILDNVCAKAFITCMSLSRHTDRREMARVYSSGAPLMMLSW